MRGVKVIDKQLINSVCDYRRKISRLCFIIISIEGSRIVCLAGPHIVEGDVEAVGFAVCLKCRYDLILIQVPCYGYCF